MPLNYWWVAVLFIIYIGLVLLGDRASKTGFKETPTPPNPYPYRFICHYCNKELDSTREPWLKRNCPNCTEETHYHRDCGKDPQCNGISVAHSSGHTLSINYPNLCALCGLGRDHWDTNKPCAASASTLYGSVNSLMRFTAADERWLHTMRITLYDNVGVNQKG